MSDELTIWERPVNRRGFVAGATAAALTAAGLGRFGAADALAAAEAEGTLFYYNWAQYVNPKTYAAFTKATGVKVKKGFYDSNETLHAKLKGGARGYDLVCPTGYMTKVLIAEKRLQPLDWSLLKNVTKNVDPKFHNTPDDPKSTYSVVKDWGTTGFMYRTDKIKERPTSWREFVALTKKYSKTAMVDSSPEVVGSIATMLGYSYNTDDQKELDEVRKVLLDLKPHVVALHSSNYDTLIAKGQAWMGLGWNGDGLLLVVEGAGAVRRRERRAARSGSTTTTSRTERRIPRRRTPGSTSSTSRRSTASRRRTRTTARRSSGRCSRAPPPGSSWPTRSSSHRRRR